MACGKPVLVGNQDGSREAIINGENGFVTDPLDLKKHQEIIEQYIHNPGVLKAHSENAWRIARSHFSYTIFKNKHIEFLNNFASNKV